ncbi:MAG: CTP synthase [Candidatus Cloacimonetes bacterium]|nr:CTP synthase [Candidatus Cloacimonadota bacterium]
MAKYIFVMGGVLSSLGKGIATATIGLLLKEMGYKVSLQKYDPYLNVDPSMMSPFQHGEVFVTDDGAETDLDLGHYERFVDVVLTRDSSCSAGQIYETVLDNERRGMYSGMTVQVIPHVTDEIKKRIKKLDRHFDVIITEIGGTVGDIESLPFLEAVRQLRLELGTKNCLCVLLTYVPYIKTAGELKTKPSQHSTYKLREIGIQPDILLCRSEMPFEEEIYSKIALFTNVPTKNVFNAIDVDCVYEVPLVYQQAGFSKVICDHFDLEYREPELKLWHQFLKSVHRAEEEINIAICGQYVRHQDSYKSVREALLHAAAANQRKVNIRWIETEHSLSDEELKQELADIDGIILPGGFGMSDIEGKIIIAGYAREHNIPFFGICLGLHAMVIEYARNVCGLTDAHSTEFAPHSPHPVLHQIDTAKYKRMVGGNMRLGAYPCSVQKGSLAYEAYQMEQISERHRHRYEINNTYNPQLNSRGMMVSGTSPDGMLIEIMELKTNDFYIGVQFHPEFKSRPQRPHPLFNAFIAAVIRHGTRHQKSH